MKWASGVIAFLLLLAAPPAAADLPDDLLEAQAAVRQARDRVLPCLVRVQPIKELYVGGRKMKQTGFGSGVIFTHQGHVLTNYHVAGRATNLICKLCLLGEDLLIGSGYSGNNIRSNDSVIVIRDARLDDPAVKGKSEYPFAWWQPLWAKYPSYAALEAMADLPSAGLVRTALRGYQGCDWHRNVFWVKGAYFAVIDEVTARRAVVYYVESNLKTCPVARKSYPRLTPRTWKLLPGRRGLSQTLRTKGEPTDLLLLTDGTSPIRTEKVSHQYIDALMVRQVREGQKLSAGQKVTFINLFCGRRGRAGPAWRIERLGATDALIFRGREAVAYFGCGQGPKGRAVLPIDARMFLLTGGRLAVVDGRSAGKLLEGARPASREIAVPPAAARHMQDRLAGRLRGR